MADDYDVSLLSREGIDALLAFLPYFQDRSAELGEPVRVDAGCVCPAMLSEKSIEFCDACYKHGFVQSFDWQEWARNRERLVSDGEGIERLGLADVGRLITVHLRNDRFCDGQGCRNRTQKSRGSLARPLPPGSRLARHTLLGIRAARGSGQVCRSRCRSLSATANGIGGGGCYVPARHKSSRLQALG